MVGTWKLAEMQPATLPEKVASVFADVTSHLLGAKYIPVLYCGEQVVQGMNYMIICKQTLAVSGAPERLVTMVINSFEQHNAIVKIEGIV